MAVDCGAMRNVVHAYYMTVRTVRLDDGSERALREVQRATGLSVSAVLKQGIAAVHQAVLAEEARDPWSIYAELDLGPGGTARAPARRAKQAIAGVLRARHARR